MSCAGWRATFSQRRGFASRCPFGGRTGAAAIGPGRQSACTWQASVRMGHKDMQLGVYSLRLDEEVFPSDPMLSLEGVQRSSDQVLAWACIQRKSVVNVSTGRTGSVWADTLYNVRRYQLTV